MTDVVVRAGEGITNTRLAQDLLATAADLGLKPEVVSWSPVAGFRVPETVAAAYAASQGAAEDETEAADESSVDGDEDGDAEILDTTADTAGTARRYSDDEKTAAVKQVLEDGRSIRAVAEEIGASENTVSRWVKTAREGSLDG